MKVYAFVPAKSTSERVENKNMLYLDGERLFIRAIKTLLRCKEIDRVFLDTESEEMFKLVDYLPIHFMKRDSSLASNKTDGHALFMNEVNSYPDADIYVQMLCTSPFIKPETIDNAIRQIKDNEKYDSAVLMKKDRFYIWKDGRPTYNINHIPNSNTLEETYIESMGLYIVKRNTANLLQRRYGDHPLMVYGDLEESVDVNTKEDLRFAEIFAKGQRSSEIQRLRLLKHFISSPALSDILDDMHLETGESCGAVLNKFSCNLEGIKLLGRANTLKLRKLKKGEDYRGIYKTLFSYDGIAENDIIVVENEERNYAYFGDLNCRLAIRKGASGVIINGATRDKNETRNLNFPVLSRGYNAADVRGRATLDYINKPIIIDKVTIHPGDTIFADECAVVVIYQKFHDEVIARALRTHFNEKDIVADIVDNKDYQEIIEKRGAF